MKRTIENMQICYESLKRDNAELLEALGRIHINSNKIAQAGNAAKMKGALIAINRTTAEAIRKAQP